MHYLMFAAAVAKSHSEQTRARKGRLPALIAAVMILSTVWADFAFTPLPVKADSEASSQASSESGAYLRRRRGRYRNYQNQQQNQQSMAVKQELKREAKERNQQQQRQQRSLARGPQIKEYGSGRNHQSGITNPGQNNQSQANSGQTNATP
jgi:hypothetical protein